MGRHSWAPSLGRLPGSLRLEKKGEPPPGAVLSTPKMHHQHWDAQARCKQAVCIPHCKDACIALKSAWGGGGEPSRTQVDATLCKNAFIAPKTAGGWERFCTQVDAMLCKNACIAPKTASGWECSCSQVAATNALQKCMHHAQKCIGGGSPPVAGLMQYSAKMHALPPKMCMGGGCSPAPGSTQPFAKMHASPQKLHLGVGELLHPG